jgi:hypothetical protein
MHWSADNVGKNKIVSNKLWQKWCGTVPRCRSISLPPIETTVRKLIDWWLIDWLIDVDDDEGDEQGKYGEKVDVLERCNYCEKIDWLIDWLLQGKYGEKVGVLERCNYCEEIDWLID